MVEERGDPVDLRSAVLKVWPAPLTFTAHMPVCDDVTRRGAQIEIPCRSVRWARRCCPSCARLGIDVFKQRRGRCRAVAMVSNSISFHRQWSAHKNRVMGRPAPGGDEATLRKCGRAPASAPSNAGRTMTGYRCARRRGLRLRPGDIGITTAGRSSAWPPEVLRPRGAMASAGPPADVVFFKILASLSAGSVSRLPPRPPEAVGAPADDGSNGLHRRGR